MARSHVKPSTHSQKAQSQRPAVCTTCGRQVARRRDLPRHMEIHSSDPGRFPCTHPGCSLVFRQKSNLKTHLNVHLEIKDHACPTSGCGFTTGDPGSLTRHRKRRHRYIPEPRAPRKRIDTHTLSFEDQQGGSLLSFPQERVSPTPSTSSESESDTETLSKFTVNMYAPDAAFPSGVLDAIPAHLTQTAGINQKTLMSPAFWTQFSHSFTLLTNMTIGAIQAGFAFHEPSTQQLIIDLLRQCAESVSTPSLIPSYTPPTFEWEPEWTPWSNPSTPTSSNSTQSEPEFGDISPFTHASARAALPSPPSSSGSFSPSEYIDPSSFSGSSLASDDHSISYQMYGQPQVAYLPSDDSTAQRVFHESF